MLEVGEEKGASSLLFYEGGKNKLSTTKGNELCAVRRDPDWSLEEIVPFLLGPAV